MVSPLHQTKHGFWDGLEGVCDSPLGACQRGGDVWEHIPHGFGEKGQNMAHYKNVTKSQSTRQRASK